ncbi:MAG TPA: phage portal protein [Gemmataceae bacterium]|nr:phage portal protein [Gemmataceae bacterium]
MRQRLAAALHRLAKWLWPDIPAAAWTTYPLGPDGAAERQCRLPMPSSGELLRELRNTAYACAALNASVCAAHPPSLYVATFRGQPAPKCLTRPLSPPGEQRLRQAGIGPFAKAEKIEQVLDHPLLTLLRAVNPLHNAHDLWELTTLYQEIFGVAYWLITLGPLGIPEAIWILPSQHMMPRRSPGSVNPVDYYEYGGGSEPQRFGPDEIICFSYPDPRNPYHGGLSPLRAAYEQVVTAAAFSAFKREKFANQALPDAILSPDDALGEDEAARLERQWQQKFGPGGAGRVLVAESGLKVSLLEHSIGDLAALADYRATKEDIANAFGVPLAFLTSETNLANLQAAEHQHLSKAIRPRLQRRDQKLNERLLPFYDPDGRLFLASDDPTPENQEQLLRQQEADLRWGVKTINDIRQERGLPPVAWGHEPWLPVRWAPVSRPRGAPSDDE